MQSGWITSSYDRVRVSADGDGSLWIFIHILLLFSPLSIWRRKKMKFKSTGGSIYISRRRRVHIDRLPLSCVFSFISFLRFQFGIANVLRLNLNLFLRSLLFVYETTFSFSSSFQKMSFLCSSQLAFGLISNLIHLMNSKPQGGKTFPSDCLQNALRNGKIYLGGLHS